MDDPVSYDSILDILKEPVLTEIMIYKDSNNNILDIEYSKQKVNVTQDKNISFPSMMVLSRKNNGLAEKYNINPGDIILKINNTNVTPQNYHQLMVSSKNINILIDSKYTWLYQAIINDPKQKKKFNLFP